MIEEYAEKIKSFLSSGKGIKLAVLLGVAGIIIIFVSSLVPEKKTSVSENNSDIQSFVSSAAMEIENVVSSITGEKSPVVYITAESDVSKIYAVEKSADEKSTEEKVVIIKNSDGDQTGLLLNQIQPEIKGVVVVSSGADDPIIREKIITAVKTAFDIPSNKVCVVSKYNRSK